MYMYIWQNKKTGANIQIRVVGYMDNKVRYIPTAFQILIILFPWTITMSYKCYYY